jgi:hypothetical protein
LTTHNALNGNALWVQKTGRARVFLLANTSKSSYYNKLTLVAQADD